MARKVTKANLPLVWLRLTQYVANTLAEGDSVETGGAVRLFCRDLNAFLDGMANEDAFGTEGQCDPRGDQRN